MAAVATIGVNVWNNAETLGLGGQHAAIETQQAEIARQAHDTTVLEYNIKVYDKVFSWIDVPAKKGLAVALIETITDPAQRLKLNQLLSSPILTNEKDIQDHLDRSNDNAVKQAIGEWNYAVYWCAGKPANERIAQQVLGALQGATPRAAVEQKSFTDKEAASQKPPFEGFQVRYVTGNQPQAEVVKKYLSQVSDKFKITPAFPHQPKPSFIALAICE